ncbi:hypothetical protein Bca52824_065920 [Brassica carinata]|uniref:Ubiquitin-like protease family profile domain-containing protein n=1 Tax=Brassica carinata TaxID=52824 RepID=A0A8X7U9L7_BRACI|nr:hypothetical protein Bca52824_065920 [Brassica carinata]
MKKSKLSQTTVRRRTKSSGEELPERPPAKQQRYPDSGSEDGPGGGDSSGGHFPDGVPSSVLPRRLFAYGVYPTKLRVNINSKSHVIGSVAAALKGTDAMDTLMASQFRGLCLLSRQLVTARRQEFWFTFGPDPLHFSLDEFRDVTGLNCGAFDVQDSEASESVPPTMWNKLFDTAVGANPLQVMRDRLSQKTTVCNGFPLALQLFIFDVVPLLLEKIPDAGNTATFIDSPGACSSPSTILTVNEIVVVEEDPDLSVHFTVIPDEERLLLVDQNEDRQVTSLDFPGGDQSFSPKFKVPDAALGEGACPTPVRQINLRPRNTASIEVEDISSSGNSGEENRQCSERCTHENLKHWISQQFEGMENNIEELRTLICKSLGLPEGSKRNARKRKAMDDPQVRRTPSPDDNIVSETEGRNRKGKKRKTVGTRHVGKKTLPRVDLEEVSRKNPPSSERESGHQNDDDHAKENESDNARFHHPRKQRRSGNQETQSNALVLFGDVLDVELESYVLPAEHAVTSPGAWQKRNPTYRYEQGSPVTWEKTKPNCYSSVGSVRSFHPSWDGNPSSKSKEISALEGGEGHQKWVGAPPVGYESGQTSNQNDGEGLEQVSAPMGFVEALVKEINSEIPGADEEIRATRGGEGAQPKENESIAACMTPTVGIDFAQKMGADNGGESGQTSNQNDGERLEQVSAPMGFVEALVKEINSEISGANEEIRATRGGEGAQPKENKSVAARMTPTAGIGFAQKMGGDNGGEFVEEDPDGGEEARTADKHPQSVDSVETSNMEFPKPVEAVGKVAPPKAGGEASVKEINTELQGTEDEERYDSCKDDMSTDSQIQENPRALCGETDADSEDVGSGGKRHRMRSNKISGVYTPDPRVKKLFKSEEKVEYKPIAKTNRTQFKMFTEILRENPEQMWDIATGHSVYNHFFLEIAEPGKWMSDEYFIKTIQSNWSAFSADNDKLQFEWGKNVAQYVTGKSKGQKMKLGLGRDVDTVYTPMNWGGDHWVGLCIKLTEGHVTVFDSYVPHTEIEVAEGHMCSVVQSLPYILEKYVGHKCYKVKEGLRIYSWSRAEGIYHNKRGGDCGPCAAKFIEMHAAGLTEEMSRITDKDVDRFREQYAMDCYEEFVGDSKVNNE